MPNVTIKVLSDDPVPVFIENVVVEFYDAITAEFQTNGMTGSNGEVIVSLLDGSCDVLFYKTGVSILPKQPQRIVVDSLLTNTFEITGHIRAQPESIDPMRCTVSGYILGVDGKQAKHRLVFEPLKTVTILGNKIIAPYARREVTSDESGYFEFELLRDTKYSTYFVFPQDLFGEQPGKLDVITPNRPGVALDVLLFPLPVNLEFSVDEISLVTGDPTDKTIGVELTFSDGSVREVLSTPWAYVSVTNTDALVVEASISAAKELRLKPVSPGTAIITTVRVISERAFFGPLPDFITGLVTVTVT